MRRRSMLLQVLLANLLLISMAVVAATLFANYDLNVSEQTTGALVLVLAIALTVLVNYLVLHERFQPLEELVSEMEQVDLTRSNDHVAERPADDSNGNGSAGASGPEEVERLHRAFSAMLERLETERRQAARDQMRAQEEERTRVARDLHDEVNQALTALSLRLEAARSKAPPELAAELNEIKALATRAMRELLALARQLRPTALDDLGLKAALNAHVDELRADGRRMSFSVSGNPDSASPEAQLAAYRVAQEALANAVRHGGPRHIWVRLGEEGGRLDLTIRDDGCGFEPSRRREGGLGIAGMRERALLVGGDLSVESKPKLGTRVRLKT